MKWEHVQVSVERVTEEEVMAEEKETDQIWTELISDLLEEEVQKRNWGDFMPWVLADTSAEEICEVIGATESTSAATIEDESDTIGFVDNRSKQVFFFVDALVEEIRGRIHTLKDIQKVVRGYVRHEHRHVQQYMAFNAASIDLETVWSKVRAERDAYGYFGVMLEQDAFAVQFDCCEWDLQTIVDHYAD